MQRKAFLLLVLEHAAAALEVPDRGRYDAYKRAPKSDAILARRWRALACGPATETTPAPNASVTHLLAEGTMARRFSELVDFHALPEEGTVSDDDMLLALEVAETEQTAACVFGVATLALHALDDDNPHPKFVSDPLRSFEHLYEVLGAHAALASHVDSCLAFAREFSGSLESAAAATAQARARASAVLAVTAPD